MSELGKAIMKRREELGMSQDELAIRMGYKSRSTISKIEKGVNDVVQSNIVKFAEVLKTTPAHLLGWDQEQIDVASEQIKDKNSYDDALMKSFIEEISEMVLNPEDIKRIQKYAEMMQKADLRVIADYFHKVYELQLTEQEIQKVFEYAKFIISQRNT